MKLKVWHILIAIALSIIFFFILNALGFINELVFTLAVLLFTCIFFFTIFYGLYVVIETRKRKQTIMGRRTNEWKN
jgi:ABC-type Na+ efflux pump permease subunit